MNCRHAQQLLFEDLDAIRRNDRDRQVEEHLRDCEPCRRLHAASIRVERQLLDMAGGENEPRRDLERLAVERWLSERGTRPVGAAREFLKAARESRFSFVAFSRLVSGLSGKSLLRFLSSLRDWVHLHPSFPALKCWAITSRPSGTGVGWPLPFPAMNRWAITSHPSGTETGRVLPDRPVRRLWLGSAAAVLLSALGLVGWMDSRAGRSDLDPGLPPSHRKRIATVPLPTASRDASSTEAQRERRATVISALRSTTGHVPRSPADAATKTTPGRGDGQTPHLAAAPASLGDLLADRNPGKEAARGQVPRFTAGEWEDLEEQVRRRVPVRDDFVTIPFPRLAAASDRQVVAAIEAYKREAAIVDPRLSQEVTLQFKATALSDLCDQLRAETGIRLEEGRSVADEKVTVFCRKLPLRDVMRQLSRPFGYTWIRSGKEGDYRYELVQDLRSQLLEEELRSRDRNAALLALEREIDRYRPYLDLSPDEALARGKGAAPREKGLLEKLAGRGWGPIQMYFRLSSRDLSALRAGQTLTFSQEPKPGEQQLPPDVARGVLQCMRWARVRGRDGEFEFGDEKNMPDGLPPTAVPEARALVTLTVEQSELGRFVLNGASGFFIGGGYNYSGEGPYAVGLQSSTLKPGNGVANARLAGDPTLRRVVSIQPRASCENAGRRTTQASQSDDRRQSMGPPPSSVPTRAGRLVGVCDQVTCADILEALHQATGLPIVGDHYTRLYPPARVTVKQSTLFEALNLLADAASLRWNKGGDWLQFRSTNYYDDRLKEVPNHLLTRWAAARRQRGWLTLDELTQIAQLSDAQLDAREMAVGARECWGLTEWNMVRGRVQRPHFRYLASLSPAQRQATMRPDGLPMARMSLAQQQQFIAGTQTDRLDSPEALERAALRVEQTQPGWFEWRVQDPLSLGRGPIRLPPVRERTREAALQAARRMDPQADPAKIVASELSVTILYNLGTPQTGGMTRAVRVTPDGPLSWGYSFRSEGDGGERPIAP